MNFKLISNKTMIWVVTFLLTVNAVAQSGNPQIPDILEQLKARTYKRIVTDDVGLAEFRYQVQSGEVVLFAWSDGNGGPLLPLVGYVYPDNTKELGLEMYVAIMDPAYKFNKSKKWSVQFGNSDQTYDLYGARAPEPVIGETRLSGHSHSLPLLLPGNVEVWSFPFRILGNRTESLVAFIGESSEAIRNSAHFQPESVHFSWGSSFITARTLSTPPIPGEWSPWSRAEPTPNAE